MLVDGLPAASLQAWQPLKGSIVDSQSSRNFFFAGFGQGLRECGIFQTFMDAGVDDGRFKQFWGIGEGGPRLHGYIWAVLGITKP